MRLATEVGRRALRSSRAALASSSSSSSSSLPALAPPRSAGQVRSVVGQVSEAVVKSMTNASINAVVEALVLPGDKLRGIKGHHNEPTVVIEDAPYLEEEEMVMDLARQPDKDKLAAYAKSVEGVDAFELVRDDIRSLSEGIRALVGDDNPIIEKCAQYFFEKDGGKKLRPTMVLLIAKAVGQHMAQQRGLNGGASASVSKPRVINGDVRLIGPEEVYDRQRRLAEIIEMIHTASLLHDDVIDEAETRRGVASINKLYGNKTAILVGDFLLARASVNLARLRDHVVMELLATLIEDLVKGEVMQARPILNGTNAFQYYLKKNYFKTGSLMAKACRSAVVLGSWGQEMEDLATAYGTHVGLAFQLVDDVLDFEQSSETLGKPAHNDIKQGLATAPVLLAAQDYPELTEVIKRKFKGEGDVEMALKLVAKADGLRRTKDLAEVQVQMAIDHVMRLEPSPGRDALVKLAMMVVSRDK